MLNPFIAIALDLVILGLNIYIAISQRGTWIGWLFTGLVIWQILAMIRAIKYSFND